MLSKVMVLLGIKGGLLLVGFLVSGVSLLVTSQDVFCLSCHEMRSYKEELSRSPHAKDANGKPIGCAQCHVSSSGLISLLETKVAVGINSLWTHFTSENLLLDRSVMRETARKYVADANCRSCHENLLLNASQTGPVPPKAKPHIWNILKKIPIQAAVDVPAATANLTNMLPRLKSKVACPATRRWRTVLFGSLKSASDR